MSSYSLAHYPAPTPQRGFTLVEILIAVAIFALIGIAAYSVLGSGINAGKNLQRHSQRNAELERAMMRLAQDIRQLSLRTTRNAFGDRTPLLRGESGFDDSTGFIEFTRSGWRNPAGLPRSDLEHVVYKLKDGIFWRLSWLYLDRANSEADIKRPMIKHVEKITFKFLDKQNQWQKQWANLNTDAGVKPPRAILVELELKEGIKLKREFVLGAGKR